MSIKFLLKRRDGHYNEWEMIMADSERENHESHEMLFKPHILGNIMSYLAIKGREFDTIRVEMLRDGEEEEANAPG